MWHPEHLAGAAGMAVIALLMILLKRRIGGLLATYAASHCGIILVTFTRGASGGTYLAQLFALLILPFVFDRRVRPARDSSMVTKATFGLIVMFYVGVLVGLGRYDPALESIKSGTFQSVAGIPLSVLMAGYRAFTVTTFLAVFMLPLRYRVDRSDFVAFLTVSWIMVLILCVARLIDTAGLATLSFSFRGSEYGIGHNAVIGYGRQQSGVIYIIGIYQAFALTYLTKSHTLKTLAWISAPLLIITLLFSWSRSATMAMAVSSVTLAVTMGGTRGLKGVLIVGLGAAIVGVTLAQFEDVSERMNFFMTGEIGGSGQARLDNWGMLLGYLFQRPDVLLFGAGYQNFHYMLNLGEQAVFLETAHNTYLHTLTEFGIFGFLLFATWLSAMFLWLVRFRRSHPDPKVKTVCGILMTTVFGVMVASLTVETVIPSYPQVPFVLHFYLILATWISWYRTEMEQLRQGTRRVTPVTAAGGAPARGGPIGYPASPAVSSRN